MNMPKGRVTILWLDFENILMPTKCIVLSKELSDVLGNPALDHLVDFSIIKRGGEFFRKNSVYAIRFCTYLLCATE